MMSSHVRSLLLVLLSMLHSIFADSYVMHPNTDVSADYNIGSIPYLPFDEAAMKGRCDEVAQCKCFNSDGFLKSQVVAA